MDLDWLDLMIGLFVVSGVIRGYRRGLIREGMAFGGLAVGLILAVEWSPVVAGVLKPFVGGGRALDVFAYLLVVMAALGAATLITVIALRLVRALLAGWVDRLGGALFGAGQGIVLAAMVLILMVKFPFAGLDRAVRGSDLAIEVLALVPALLSWLPEELSAITGFFNSGNLQ